jgi:hypothetical protein
MGKPTRINTGAGPSEEAEKGTRNAFNMSMLLELTGRRYVATAHA